HNEKFPPPNGSIPFEDRDEESAPDEAYLPSYQLASQLTVNEAGNSHKSQHVPFDLDLLSVHSARTGQSVSPHHTEHSLLVPAVGTTARAHRSRAERASAPVQTHFHPGAGLF